jgi:hypothetical protein
MDWMRDDRAGRGTGDCDTIWGTIGAGTRGQIVLGGAGTRGGFFTARAGRETPAAREGSQLGYARGRDIWQLVKNSNLFYQTVREGILLVLPNFEDGNLVCSFREK